MSFFWKWQNFKTKSTNKLPNQATEQLLSKPATFSQSSSTAICNYRLVIMGNLFCPKKLAFFQSSSWALVKSRKLYRQTQREGHQNSKG